MSRKRPVTAVLRLGVVVLVTVCASSCASGSSSGRGQGARHVEFIVTGRAPNGVDVIYGSDKSHYQGSLPMDVKKPIVKNTTYYVSAQLQGGGRIVCKVRIGDAVRTGHAVGGYNTCTAQSPNDPLGGWN